MAVKFEIYRDGKRVMDFQPVAAIAMGPESVPIEGSVSFRDGLLTVERSEEHAVGVALLWDMGPFGSYHMETTRLRHRQKPYNLNVELARLRLMKIVQKQEDWNLFDIPRGGEKFSQQLKDAQAVFADALGHLEEPIEAAKLADESLVMSVELSEQLATLHGDMLLNRRKASNQFARHLLGCRVNSSVQNQKYKDSLSAMFDYAVVPMPWKQIQPEEGAFETPSVDEWIETLNRKRVPVIGGPLIRLAESDVPDWMFIWEHDYETLRQMAYEYVQKVVHRYRKGVGVWNVVAGLSANKIFPLSFEQLIELTRLLISQVKNMLPQARTLVTITQPYGEYHAKGPGTVPPMLYAEMVAQAGINFEAFGLEVEMGVPAPGAFARDLFQFSCMLDRFSTLGRPLFITAISAPSRNTPDPGDLTEGKLDPAAAGRWRRPWDPQLQAEWMEAVYRIALSKPYVESIAWGDLADISQNLPGGGMLDDMLRPKPALQKMQEMRVAYHAAAAARKAT
jgi:hypothetical protein